MIRAPPRYCHLCHFDALYQACHVACLIMLNGAGCPIERGLPKTGSATRSAFASFGGSHVLSLVTEVATRGLKAVWRQKWTHHRRMRPEVAGALITLHADIPPASRSASAWCSRTGTPTGPRVLRFMTQAGCFRTTTPRGDREGCVHASPSATRSRRDAAAAAR